jgi:glutamine synthetase
MVPPTVVSLGLESSPDIAIPREDRNRTSPFPYGRNRFEYRAVGASQNVSMVNTVLCTVAANVFKEFSQEIESGKSPEDIVRKTLSDHWRVIFNGNSYELSNQDMLTKRGLWNIGSSVDALQKLTEKKNVKLMEDMGVLTSDECESRVNVSLLHYINTVEMEANCLIDIIRQQIIPALQKNNIVNAVPIESAVRELYRKVHSIAEVQSLPEKAALSRTLRLETMIACRALCDEAEALCPSKDWPIATYTELLFTTQAVSPKRVD